MARPPRSELIKQPAASSVLSSAAPWSASGQNEKTVDAPLRVFATYALRLATEGKQEGSGLKSPSLI